MTSRFLATTARNMQSLLMQELRDLGAGAVRETAGGVFFEGDVALAYRVCLWSRVASRVLMLLGEGEADDLQGLYNSARELRWDTHFDLAHTFAVDCTLSAAQLTHSHGAALKVKDAIADQFRDRFGARPSVDARNPDLRISVFVRKTKVTFSLDLSGEALHRRGYRVSSVEAPLKETLAAAIVLRAGWSEIAARGGSFVDLMCGSGTLALEAAMIAANIAPGLLRTRWGFEHWQHHLPDVWQTLTTEAREAREAGVRSLGQRREAISAFDQDSAAVSATRANIQAAGLGQHIQVRQVSVGAHRGSPSTSPGLVLVNPPYGERLGESSQLPALYQQLGETLQRHYQGWRAAVFTGNPPLGKLLGQRAERSHKFFNGRIECRLLQFGVNADASVESGGARKPEDPADARYRGPRPVPADRRSEGASMFANRLAKNLKHLARWARRDEITCYRVYDADLPEYALAVDLYSGERTAVHVQEYQAPASIDAQLAQRRLREAIGVIAQQMQVPLGDVYVKQRRRQRGNAQYERLAQSDEYFQVQESGCNYLVNLQDRLDTGLFLDHRKTRAMLQGLAKGQRFLNLFAYTGTASVAAARGGAVSTTSVDLSRTYLDWAQRNMQANGFDDKHHAYIHSDCLQWLDGLGSVARYGLIFLDPPSFSSSKQMNDTLDIQRDHQMLIDKTMRILKPQGDLIFSNNLRRFRLDPAIEGQYQVENISRLTLPSDFERNPRIHHCWRIRHRETP